MDNGQLIIGDRAGNIDRYQPFTVPCYLPLLHCQLSIYFPTFALSKKESKYI